jgi:hypothetical protein
MQSGGVPPISSARAKSSRPRFLTSRDLSMETTATDTPQHSGMACGTGEVLPVTIGAGKCSRGTPSLTTGAAVRQPA